MKIRKVDSKNRVTIDADGSTYAEHVAGDGTITLRPIKIPEVPRLGTDENLLGIYVAKSGFASKPDTVTVNLQFPSNERLVTFVASIAEEFQCPIVVRAQGIGAYIAEELTRATKQQVIEVLK
jgi:hypothetical protein